MIDNEMKPVVGIDLGTTYSCIARWDGREPRVYKNKKGHQTTPSVVYYDKKRKWVVGDLAIGLGSKNPENAVFTIKRHMDDRNHKVRIGGTEYSPVDISAKILKSLIGDVTAKYPSTSGFEIEGVVVTVPYYFTTMQRQNTQEAAEQTGLHVLGIIEEPTAAALAFSFEHRFTPEPHKVLVFDLGGGTFDITIFEVTELPDKMLFQVLGTGGDSRLGGWDFDGCIIQYCVEQFQKKHKVNPLEVESEKDRGNALSLARVITQAIKEELSSTEETEIIIIPDFLPGKHFETDITRTTFESLIQPWSTNVEKIVENTMETAGVRARDLDIVVAAGGSSRIPTMMSILKKITGKEPFHTDPDLHIAKGAAIYAAILDGRIKDRKPVEVVNRTSHALGVGTAAGRFEILIPANRVAPTKAKKVFTTSKDNSTELDVDIYEGSAGVLDQNTKIGTIKIRGLQPRPKGELSIYVTFEVSRTREITVTIEQKESGIFINETLTVE